MIIHCKDDKSIKNIKNPNNKPPVDNNQLNNKQKVDKPSPIKPPIDDDANYFDSLIKNNDSDDFAKNQTPEINEDSLIEYINENLDQEDREAFLKTFFTENNNSEDTKVSDLKLKHEDLKNLDTQKIMSYLSQFHNKSAYEKIKKTVIPLNRELISKLQEQLPKLDTSKLHPLRTEAFDINNPEHVRILKKMELSGKVNRHNPPSRETFIEKAQNSGIDGSYYICYNENNKTIGVFSIYSSSAGMGDIYSFFMAIDEFETGKGYGTSIVIAALIQIASLNTKKLIECRSVHTLVEEQNIGSMKIMEKLVKMSNNGQMDGMLFGKYYSRSLNACKFDLSKIYQVILQIVSQTT
jgi:RimJ/RimL family protein N-acetyltransferase